MYNTYKSSTWEAEAEELWIWSQSGLQFENSLNYLEAIKYIEKTYTLVGMPDNSPIEETIAICLRRVSKNANAKVYQ